MNENYINFDKLIINYLNSKEFKVCMTKICQPLFKSLLNEIGIYLYIFIFYILASFFLHLGILIILIRYIKENKYKNKYKNE